MKQKINIFKIKSTIEFKYLLLITDITKSLDYSDIISLLERHNYKIWLYIKNNQFYGFDYYDDDCKAFTKKSNIYKIYNINKIIRKKKLNRINETSN